MHRTLSIHEPGFPAVSFQATVASDAATRARGLSGAWPLYPMLFVWGPGEDTSRDVIVSHGMRDDFDVLFLDAQGVGVDYVSRMGATAPGRRAQAPFRYVLELPAGTLESLGMAKVGGRVHGL